jgi:signal transduction histidine kinase
MADDHIDCICAQCLELLVWAWGHGIPSKTQALLDEVRAIRLKLEMPSPHSNDISARLDHVEDIVEKIAGLSSPFQLEQVSINSLVTERVEKLQQMEAYQTVIFQLDLEPSTLVVRANSTWLRRLLDILIDNAVDATRERAKKQIRISTGLSERGVRIAVSDTGGGIAGQFVPSLFAKPLVLQTGGRGRGMYIARLLVEIYGGQIEVEHTGPTGTTMVVWVPLWK